MEEIASDGSLQFHGLRDELPFFQSIAINSIHCNLHLLDGKHHFLLEVLELSFFRRKLHCDFTLITELSEGVYSVHCLYSKPKKDAK